MLKRGTFFRQQISRPGEGGRGVGVAFSFFVFGVPNFGGMGGFLGFVFFWCSFFFFVFFFFFGFPLTPGGGGGRGGGGSCWLWAGSGEREAVSRLVVFVIFSFWFFLWGFRGG